MEDQNTSPKPARRGYKKVSGVESEITARFFEALAKLIETGAIRNKTFFPEHYGINRRNFEEVALRFPKYKARMEWIHYICRDYGVSARWILLGEGKMLSRRPHIVRYQKKNQKTDVTPYLIGKAPEPELPLESD
ncbi:MAG: hypothetical protein LUC24_03375 [Bacteroidales bacterium]|nr:hypothetical protein [Bacteroidales bacterium]